VEALNKDLLLVRVRVVARRGGEGVGGFRHPAGELWRAFCGNKIFGSDLKIL
jgi:hypothetical protein